MKRSTRSGQGVGVGLLFLGLRLLRLERYGHQVVDSFRTGEDRALAGSPVVNSFYEAVIRPHLEGSQFPLCHAPSCSKCNVDTWLTGRQNLRVIT
jgi:hypothetical protein